ncbi:MAG: NAD(P)-binding protein [Gemmatimonadetes bacterium]|nr:NAD(P)-binding protein [Gemmatimonadota bacterium]
MKPGTKRMFRSASWPVYEAGAAGTGTRRETMPYRIAIVGGGISGLGAAWALHHHPDRFDFELFEARDTIGGNAVTADMPQDGGGSIPFDISVTACIPSVYHHIVLLMERFGIDLIDTRFSYSVKYGGRVYAHDFDSDIKDDLQAEIDRFQRILKRLHRFGWMTRSRSKFVNALNPYNYVSMGTVLNLAGLSGDFRHMVLKPMFVNFLMATNVFDMPASLFSRYLEFFDIESATPMQTWDHGTRRIYENLSAGFRDRISLNRPVRKVHRHASHVVVEDENGVRESFDQVIFACNANQSEQNTAIKSCSTIIYDLVCPLGVTPGITLCAADSGIEGSPRSPPALREKVSSDVRGADDSRCRSC